MVVVFGNHQHKRNIRIYEIHGELKLVAPLLPDASCLIELNKEYTMIQRYDVTAATIFRNRTWNEYIYEMELYTICENAIVKRMYFNILI